MLNLKLLSHEPQYTRRATVMCRMWAYTKKSQNFLKQKSTQNGALNAFKYEINLHEILFCHYYLL